MVKTPSQAPTSSFIMRGGRSQPGPTVPSSGPAPFDLIYGPSGSCPNGGYGTAPANMLCKATYTGFGGGSTDLYYSGGHLARLVNPGGEITDFGYDATGALTQVRDPRTNDLIYANVIADGAADTHKTLIAYSGGKVTSVRRPRRIGGHDRCAACPAHL